MSDSPASSTSRPSVRRLSFSFQREDSRPVPLHAKIGGGEKGLITLAQTLFDSLYKDPVFVELYTKANIPMDPNYYYNYVLHITGKKPYNGEYIRKQQLLLGFRSQHFSLLLKYLAEASVTLGLQGDVIKEILEAAVTTKSDMRGKPIQGTISYW